MEERYDDVAGILDIDQDRAKELVRTCYDTIAALQLKHEDGQIGKAIETLKRTGKTNREQFYIGFALGRIVQLHVIANVGLGPLLENDAAQLEKAKNGMAKHPEFG